jgi:competence protein ComEA
MKVIRSAVLAGCAMVVFATFVFAATLIDVNTASSKELASLKGVGPATASKIIAARPYRSIDELSRAGLSAKQIGALRPLVTISGAAAPTAKPTAVAKSAANAKAAAKPATSTAPVPAKPAASSATAVAKPAASTATASRPASAGAAAAPVDLNTASQKDLEALKGIGAATAKKIIAARPLASVDDLSKAGVSARTIAELRPSVTVSRTPATVKPAVRAGKTATPSPAPVTARAATPVVTPAVPARATTASSPATPSPATPTPTPAPVTARAAAPVAAPASQPTAAGSTAKLASGQVVNINTASMDLLDALPGIGPVKAQAIIDGRPYATIEDIMKVKGIKQGEFAKIRNLITVH